MIIKVTPMDNGLYYATVESRGHRYYTYYYHQVNEHEVKEDFQADKNTFFHIN